MIQPTIHDYVDDIVLIAKNQSSTNELYLMVEDKLNEIGLNISASKSTAMAIEKGILMNKTLIDN